MNASDYRGFSPQYAVSVIAPVSDMKTDIPQGHFSSEKINGHGFPVLDNVYSKQVACISTADRHYSVATSGIVSSMVKLRKNGNYWEVHTPSNYRGTPLCPIDRPFTHNRETYCWYQFQIH